MQKPPPCPKCKSQYTWYEKGRTELIHRCTCGLATVVFKLEEGLNPTQVVVKLKKKRLKALPRRKTKFWYTLATLYAEEECTTVGLATRLGELSQPCTPSAVSSYLIALRRRGLVEEHAKPEQGRASWAASAHAQKMLDDIIQGGANGA